MADRYPYSNCSNSWSRPQQQGNSQQQGPPVPSRLPPSHQRPPHSSLPQRPSPYARPQSSGNQLASTSRLPPSSSAASRPLHLPDDQQPNEDLSLPRLTRPPTIADTRPVPTGPRNAIPARLHPAASPLFIPKRPSSNWGKVGRWAESSSGDAKGKGKESYGGAGSALNEGGAMRIWESNAVASTSAGPASHDPHPSGSDATSPTLAGSAGTTARAQLRLPKTSDGRVAESPEGNARGSLKGKEREDGSSRVDGSQASVARAGTPAQTPGSLAPAKPPRHSYPPSTPLPPPAPPARPVPTPISTPGDSDSLTLYVGNLPLSITQAKIETLFRPCGRIIDISLGSAPLLSHNPSGPPPVPSFRAFIKFATDREAKAAISLDGKLFEGGQLHVAVNPSPRTSRAKPTAESLLPNRLFVGKLSKDILSSTLRDAFSPFGTILAIEIKQRSTNAFAFVRFSSPSEADAALALDRSTILPGTLPISVSPAIAPPGEAPTADPLFSAPSASPAPSSQAFKRDSEALSVGEDQATSRVRAGQPATSSQDSNQQLASSTSRLSFEPQAEISDPPPGYRPSIDGRYLWRVPYPLTLVGKGWKKEGHYIERRAAFRQDLIEQLESCGGKEVRFEQDRDLVVLDYLHPPSVGQPAFSTDPPVLFSGRRIIAFKTSRQEPSGILYIYVAPQPHASSLKKAVITSIRKQIRMNKPGFELYRSTVVHGELRISLRPAEDESADVERLESANGADSDDAESLVIERIAEADELMEELPADDNHFVDRIDVPESCRGSAAAAAKSRQAFLVRELRKAFADGKIVLSNSFEGTDFSTLVLDYLVALPGEDGNEPDEEEQPIAGPALTRSPPAAQPQHEHEVDMEDVKPSIARQENMDDEVDEIDSPSPEPSPPSLPFPLGLAGSFADSAETKKQVELFLVEYFAKFDSERAGLDVFYTKSALFSVRVVTSPPSRLRQAPSPFLKRYVEAAKALSITPTPITNAIRKLPAASHDPTKIRCDAFEVLSPPHKKGRKSLLVNIYGELEEFPSHEVRSFTRTFLLVPKLASLGGAGSPLDYLISSDQITFRHRDISAPHPIAVAVPPRVPVIAPPPPAQRAPPQPAQRPPPPPASRPIPSLPHQRQAALPPPPKPAPKPVEKRRLPIEHSSSDSDNDVIIVAQPPPKRRDLRPSPTPEQAIATPPLSAKAAGKRRAVSPAPAPRRAPIVPRQAPAIVRDRSASPDSDDDEVSPAEAAASEARRRERQATVGLDFGLSRKDIEAMVAREVAKALKEVAVPARAERNVVPATVRAVAPLSSDDDVGQNDEPSDGRVFIPGSSHSIAHGYSGATNKMRHLVDTEDSLLGMTLAGDIVEWDRGCKSGSVQKIYNSKRAGDRIDAFEFSTLKDTLVVGYLGGLKVTGEKRIPQPPSQITLFKRETMSRGQSKLTPDPLPERPHYSGGVSALTLLPGSRLTFATGGQDKTLFLWTRRRTTQMMEVTPISSEHTALVNSMCHVRGKKWLVSGGADKRVLAYDLGHQKIVWRKMLPASVSVVQEVPSDPSLLLCRLQSTQDQFHLFDLRRPSTLPPVMHFGFALPATTSTTTSALVDRTLSRYLLGSFSSTLYATPDSESGIKMYDIRRAKGEGAVVQSWAGAGRSRVVQTLFQGPNSLALAEIRNFTLLKLV